jgi:exodeoxyribonuclease VII large subunit
MPENRNRDEVLTQPSLVIPVSLLNRLAREKLESAFPPCWVAGEISNLTNAASGHLYFSLKDASAQVRCVMFRSRAQLLGWRLENGQHIEARVLVTLYEARGDFQLNVEAARRAGRGSLYEQFLRLKDRLEREGLFDSRTKRSLPGFPHRIGIVTSPHAAALRDVLTTLSRRAPQVSIVLYPTPVQGEGSGERIAAALRVAGERNECDVLLLCRGGGSLEDLWAFNDESVARAIRCCPIPIISGIGHETDFTIADFAADQRAATPTAAAELAAPEHAALRARLTRLQVTLLREMEQKLEQLGQQLDWLAHRMQHPRHRLARQRESLLNLRRRLDAGLRQTSARGQNALRALSQRLLLCRPDTARHDLRQELLARRLRNAWQQSTREQSARLFRLAANLAHLNPASVLARGYSIVTTPHGETVRSAESLELNDEILVSFHRGRVAATLTSVTKDFSISPDGVGDAPDEHSVAQDFPVQRNFPQQQP